MFLDVLKEFAKAQNLSKEFEQFLNYSELKIIKGEVYAVPVLLKNFVSEYYVKLVYIGKRLGRYDGKFKPSISFYEELFNYTDDSKIVKLPYKKAWLLVCGRDVFKKNLNLNPNQQFYFITYHDSFIGFVKYNSEKSFLKNLSDIGIYVRNQKKI